MSTIREPELGLELNEVQQAALEALANFADFIHASEPRALSISDPGVSAG